MIKATKGELLYDIISCDTTSNCNIRCRFCFNNWEKLGANVNMDRETFEKMLSLLPLARDNSFYLSCLFEPFINKDFIDWLRLVPAEYSKKCFFTTNLVAKLSDEQIEKLSRIHIDHINISMESLNADTYNALCDKSNFDNYYDNLTRLTSAFAKAENPPKLRYISMILKENYNELPFIAYRSRHEFLSSENEFRTPYVGPNMRLEWLDDQILTKQQLSALTGILGCLGMPMEIDTGTDTDNYMRTIDSKRRLTEEEFEQKEARERYFQLRISSDGLVKVYALNRSYDLHDIDNPYEFFSDLLKQLYVKRISSDEISDTELLSSAVEAGSDLFCIDDFTDRNGILELRGWSALSGADMSSVERYLCLSDGTNSKCYKVNSIHRPDVAAALGSEGCLDSGFSVCVDADGLSNEFEAFMLFKTSDGSVYSKRLADTLVR